MAKKARERWDVEIRRPVDQVVRASGRLPIIRYEFPKELEGLTVKIPRELGDRLREERKRNKTSLAALARESLERYVDEVVDGRGSTSADVKSQNGKIVVRNRKQTMFQIAIILDALQQAIDYDPKLHHNQPPPPLRIENSDYLTELRNLVEQLRHLNETLSATKLSRSGAPVANGRDVTKPAIDTRKAISKFVNNYAGTLGKSWGTAAACSCLAASPRCCTSSVCRKKFSQQYSRRLNRPFARAWIPSARRPVFRHPFIQPAS
ncbi:putative DNA-binding protein [Bradyrhizobium sp. F1.13.1]